MWVLSLLYSVVQVMGMFDKAEQEYQEVMDKKRIVENDKMKIEAVMQELDEKKNAALKTTWSKVNRDFRSVPLSRLQTHIHHAYMHTYTHTHAHVATHVLCACVVGIVLAVALWLTVWGDGDGGGVCSSIFHTLLPNAKCKLEPPEGGTVLDGLVLRVGFGDCWKDSLSELSGGQRSLLALSLILALLLFKPAPMYILDEVCFRARELFLSVLHRVTACLLCLRGQTLLCCNVCCPRSRGPRMGLVVERGWGADRRGAGLVAHAEHREHAQDPLQKLPGLAKQLR